MKKQALHTSAANRILKQLFWVLALLLPCVPMLPHHHHGCDHLCMCVDDSHALAQVHAHRGETAGQCNTSCVTRFVYHRENQQTAVVTPILLLSFFVSSLLFASLSVLPVDRGRKWVVRQGAFLPDDSNAGPFGWRAPPCS